MDPEMAARTRTLRLGQPVQSHDGKRVGRVERLVFVAESQTVKEFVLHQGRIRAHDWFVARAYIDEIAPDGTVVIRLSASEIDELPAYLKADYIEVLPNIMSRAGLPDLRQSQGSIPSDAVVFDRHSHVENHDGRRLGVLSGLVMSCDGVVSDLEVIPDRGERTALRIPLNQVNSMRHDRIRLNQSGVNIFE